MGAATNCLDILGEFAIVIDLVQQDTSANKGISDKDESNITDKSTPVDTSKQNEIKLGKVDWFSFILEILF